MKIAVIGCKGLPPKQGGIEHYSAEVYPLIVKQGHSVDIFARCSYTENSWFQSSDFNGVRIISFPSSSQQGLDAFFASALGAITASGKKYDIVHFHALGPAIFSSFSRFFSTAKIVVTCHGLDWQRAKWGNLGSRFIMAGERATVSYADELIVVSKHLQSYFKQTYNRKSVYIPTAPAKYLESDPSFSYGDSLGLTQGRYMVFLGRLVPEKRPDLLIDAFPRLQASGWKLVFVGGVSDNQSYVKDLLNRIACNPNIVLAGELRGESLAEIVRGAGLFVLPSDLEGLPLAMLEAMQEGIPVVGSDIPPHQQLLGQGRGMLFEAGNLESCIRSLDWAIHHPYETAVMAKIAQDYVISNYSWENIAAENLRLYTSLVDPHSEKLISEVLQLSHEVLLRPSSLKSQQ